MKKLHNQTVQEPERFEKRKFAHVTNMELVLNMLAEATTTEISKEKKLKNKSQLVTN